MLSNQDRSKRSAVMQIRIYAQNGKTGDVMWSNRVEMEYSPASNRDNENTHKRVMYEKVVREGVKVLMEGFFANAEGVFPGSEVNNRAAPKRGHITLLVLYLTSEKKHRQRTCAFLLHVE